MILAKKLEMLEKFNIMYKSMTRGSKAKLIDFFNMVNILFNREEIVIYLLILIASFLSDVLIHSGKLLYIWTTSEL